MAVVAMATDAVSWVIFVLIGSLLYPDLIPKVSGWSPRAETSAHRIHVVDNDPEFLVAVRGLDRPLCFHLESPKNDAVRLLQDPASGILVNARVFHDRQRKKSYLGSVFLRGEDIRILAKQEVVIINEQRHEWVGMTELIVAENRVIVGENVVAVTFKHRNITLVIRRHFVTREEKDNALPRSDEGNRDNANTIDPDEDEDRIISYNDGKRDSSSIVSLRRKRETMDDSIVYRSLDTNLNGFKDSSYFKANRVMKETFIQTPDASQNNNDNIVHLVERRSASEYDLQGRHKLRGKTHRNSHFRPDEDRLHGLTSDGRQAQHARSHRHHINEHGQTVYMGVYISDSRDFSKSTHGLLGQFLFKNVSLEKINVKKGKMKARMLINQDPSRRTIALLSLRTNDALNTTRSCWRVRHQGNVVIDGSYKDYVLPSLRYNLMMKLPPHAPL